MGCGSSSLKGEEIHDLTDMPRSNPNPNPASEIDSTPPVIVTNRSASTDEPTNSNNPKKPSKSSRLSSSLAAGSFSMSSPAPRKKKKELTDEELLKHTGMTAEQLKQWGDQRVYRRQDVGGAGAAMGTAMVFTGAGGSFA